MSLWLLVGLRFHVQLVSIVDHSKELYKRHRESTFATTFDSLTYLLYLQANGQGTHFEP